MQALCLVVLEESHLERGAWIEINTQLPTATKVEPIYVGSMFDYVKFFDRKAVTVDVSREAGFTKNATFLRAIERFDVEAGDASAMVALNYTLA